MPQAEPGVNPYDQYLGSLANLRAAQQDLASRLDAVTDQHEQALAMANKAVTAAEVTAADAAKAAEFQLAAARSALQPLSQSHLIPQQIRPSGGALARTRDDVLSAQRDLASAVDRLRTAVQAELAAPSQPVGSQSTPPVAPPLEPRRRLPAWVILAVVVAALVIILLFAVI
jgi:hypothetical protein